MENHVDLDNLPHLSHQDQVIIGEQVALMLGRLEMIPLHTSQLLIHSMAQLPVYIPRPTEVSMASMAGSVTFSMFMEHPTSYSILVMALGTISFVQTLMVRINLHYILQLKLTLVGDGDDEFLLALFGPLDRDENGESIPPPPGPHAIKGIMYHKAIDLEKGLWAKFRIADESSARIALGYYLHYLFSEAELIFCRDFNGKGNIDFASMSYNVARYYEEPQPRVTIHFNQNTPLQKPAARSPITPTVWADEGLVYLPDPKELSAPATQSLIEVSGYALSVEVYPGKASISVSNDEGLKVLYGSLQDGKSIRTPLGVAAFTTSTTRFDSSSIAAGTDGAIVLRLTPTGGQTFFAKSEDVSVKVDFDVSQFKLKSPELGFKKVQDLWWGSSFKGIDFTNLSGFSFRFEDQTPIAHMQFWTAGMCSQVGFDDSLLSS